MQAPPVGEPLKIHLDATTGAVGALVKYLYTDAVDNDDITEDLIALASKYNLVQLKVHKVYFSYREFRIERNSSNLATLLKAWRIDQ